MNLREEIHNSTPLGDDYINKTIQIIKKWSLEILDEQVKEELKRISRYPIFKSKDKHDRDWVLRFEREFKKRIEETK